MIPTTAEFRGRRLFVREAGRVYATPLLLVVVAIVVADIAFAVDSIPAAFAVTRDAVVIWTANAFALLGLGALLALVDILVRRFRYLDKTIAFVLAFVGLKILPPTCRYRRPRIARRDRRARRGRGRRFTRGGPPRPASPGRGGDEAPAEVPAAADPVESLGSSKRRQRSSARSPWRRTRGDGRWDARD